ncbi:MAG: cytochrome c3 family protein [Proteobacteria bacterium]|nr:cytochrome c3 family protein [Pseudomonadota bacterium]MBU1640824.1 cytochrome c3 family protein [Pseudomonadota bacterium]
MIKPLFIPQGHSFQYPLEGYKFRLSRQAAQLSFIVASLFLLLTAGCSQEKAEEEATPPQSAQTQEPVRYTCLDCHPVELDSHHNINCTTCHLGQDNTDSQTEAHAGLISKPAHPDFMMTSCGSCHKNQVETSHNSLHFTAKNEVNTIRRAFGADHDLARAEQIPVTENPTTPLELADDLLRRRCLRCHISYDGDNYQETLRGVGCAACHLEFKGGKLFSHAFIRRTPDQQCLHCHNSNFVGHDYYGRYEHDFHWDYRTPYQKDGRDADRPYGVEYHQLSTDIHQQAGMQCIDCHPGSSLMAVKSQSLACDDCHAFRSAVNRQQALKKEGAAVIFTTPERTYTVPQKRNPAHSKYGKIATCTACHALWSFNDEGTHLFRQDAEEYEAWEALSIQGSYEVEREIFANLNTPEGYPYPFMSDKLTGKGYFGLWHKGYELRRWEFPIICKDAKGKFTTCRPLLDLHLTWMNSDGDVVFDNATPGKAPAYGLLPYTPHTIGKAGPFFKQRLQTNHHLLDQPLNLDKGPGLNPAMEAKP